MKVGNEHKADSSSSHLRSSPGLGTGEPREILGANFNVVPKQHGQDLQSPSPTPQQ